ncbi:fatty acid-binding protein, adipocyte-like [Gigantopelta aegis]|uniref:fatty acid-binding protein, adipocyte-like n=1 Tax=Gigantopelta aegis TaxID=1735272 RepID=UPI001B888F93|nr:fatty acid-binding protein, adipocyte-like [Gigantopelta aegis]
MALDCFLGKWREETKDGFDDLAEAIGLPGDKKEFYKSAKTEISYTKDGELWTINVGYTGVPNGRVFKFKLGEPYDSANLDGSPMKSVITADGSKFLEKHTGTALNQAQMDIERWVEGDTMILKCHCKGVTMISHYKRV